LTIVSCIEAGVLEPMTLRMAESLRRFGGRFADVDVIAVRPRPGPPLAPATRRSMIDLGVRYLEANPATPYTWHHYMNKPQALVAAESAVDTDAILWLDSDVIILREPADLALPDGVDFVASAPDTGIIGSHGPDDANDVFWARIAALFGRRLEDLPWLTTGDGHRIRFYVNAGVFTYRRATGLGAALVDDFERAMAQGVARRHDEVHYMDQVILGLTVLRLGLTWRDVSNASNFPVLSHLPENFDPALVAPVSVLHYHDSMTPEWYPRLLATLAASHPDVHDWLAPLGPVEDPVSLRWRAYRETLRLARGVERRRYYARLGFRKT
jgi:hypothetical protein